MQLKVSVYFCPFRPWFLAEREPFANSRSSNSDSPRIEPA